MIKSFRSLGVMVLIDNRYDRSSIPPGVSAIRASGDVGNTIPMVFVTNTDGTRGIQGASYVSLRDDLRGTMRTLRAAIDDAGPLLASSESAMAEDDAETSGSDAVSKPSLLVETQEWTNVEGRSIRAAVERIDAQAVRFVMPDGSAVDYPLENLADESRERLAQLAQPASGG